MTSTIDSAAQVGMGQGISSHPLHPATVHLPIGLLSLSFFLDSTQVIPQLSNGLNAFKLLPPAATLNAVSHYVGGAGLLFAVPTVLTGMSELYGMWKGQADQKGSVTKPLKDATEPQDISAAKLKATLTHATLNDAVVGIAAYNWWVRRQSKNLILPKTNALLSTLALPVFFYSAYLGGKLVYTYGMGVQRQGEAAEMKKKMEKSS